MELKRIAAKVFFGVALIVFAHPGFAEVPPPESLEKLVVAGRGVAQIVQNVGSEVPLGACAEGADYPQLRVTVTGIRNGNGNIRLSLYGGNPEEWLAKGKKLLRFDLPIQPGSMTICMPLPADGRKYALAVLHDENANGKTDIFSEGYAFSNNVKVILSSPEFADVVFEAGSGITDISVQMQY